MTFFHSLTGSLCDETDGQGCERRIRALSSMLGHHSLLARSTLHEHQYIIIDSCPGPSPRDATT